MVEKLLSILIKIGLSIYGYCTDFVINVANITGTSYYEVNAFIFCILWPLLTILLLGWYLVLRVRMWRRR